MASYTPPDDEKLFLDSESDTDSSSFLTTDRKKPWRRHYRAIIFHAALVCLYSIVTLFICVHIRTSSKTHEVPTPAKEATFYQINSNNVDDNPWHGVYTGNPSSELDANWNRLLRATNIRVSGNDLKAINRTSVPLADGSGDYWASMNVHHHLHCLMMIRHYIALDHYPNDVRINKFPLADGKVYPEHIEHCIEGLRLYLICQPDTHLLTYNWVDEDSIVPEKNHAVEHQCVDWERLEAWAWGRSIDLRENVVTYPDGRPFPPKHE